jgi:MurNAc alpha-1-phosphate uridylyltransferase
VAKPANVELKNRFMKAMIFSAGLGTRFKPWTDAHPKALAVVNGKSLLQRNIEWLQRFNIHEVIVNIHHFPEQVMQAIEKNKDGAVRLRSVMKRASYWKPVAA